MLEVLRPIMVTPSVVFRENPENCPLIFLPWDEHLFRIMEEFRSVREFFASVQT